MNSKNFKSVISIILTVVMILSLFSGCKDSSDMFQSKKLQTLNENNNHSAKNNDNNISKKQEDITRESSVEKDAKNTFFTLSTRWEDYFGDFETFVYGLLTSELEYSYDVFSGYIILDDGMIISGIAYTDYLECYTNDDETLVAFKTGFIPYYGEMPVIEEDLSEDLLIYNANYRNDKYKFVLAYESEAFVEHCVIYGKYLKYGVDNDGIVFYEVTDYSKKNIDENIGPLYSYDENRFLFDTEFGEYIDISGISLATKIDYEEIEIEINSILEKQDINMVSVDIESNAYFAKEAVCSYLLSLQEEKFFGYDIRYLIQIANELDPMECYRVTNDGLMKLKIYENTEDKPSTLVKILIGTGCAIMTIAGIVGSMVFVSCPVLSAAAGAMAGTGIEIFMQVVISEKDLSSIEWGKVALAAATGAVSGYLGPYVLANFSGISYFAVDTLLDSALGGIEKSLVSWAEGESGNEILKQFGYGASLGAGLSAGFKGAGKVIEKVLSSNTVSNLSKKLGKIVPKLTKKIKKFSDWLKGKIYYLKKVADSTVFHSEYISNKIAWRQIERIVNDGSDELASKSIREIIKNIDKKKIVDLNDKVIDKDTLEELFEKASDGDIVAKILLDEDIVKVVKKNGMLGIEFDETNYQTIFLSNRLKPDRKANMLEAAEILKQQWIKEPDLIPDSIKNQILDKGADLEDLMAKDLLRYIKSSDMVMHENIDMISITLVPRKLHDFAKEGIFHMGGYGLAKFIKNHMGKEFFDRFVSATSSMIVTGG